MKLTTWTEKAWSRIDRFAILDFAFWRSHFPWSFTNPYSNPDKFDVYNAIVFSKTLINHKIRMFHERYACYMVYSWYIDAHLFFDFCLRGGSRRRRLCRCAGIDAKIFSVHLKKYSTHELWIFERYDYSFEDERKSIIYISVHPLFHKILSRLEVASSPGEWIDGLPPRLELRPARWFTRSGEKRLSVAVICHKTLEE